MPCGSVFDRFCVLKENTDANLLKIYGKSMEIHDFFTKCKKIYENLLKIYGNLRNLTKCNKIYENLWKSMEIYKI